MKVKTKIISLIGIIVIIVAVGLTSLGKLAIIQRTQGRQYVTSKYSKYCYANGKEPGTIKTRIYFASLELCGKPQKP